MSGAITILKRLWYRDPSSPSPTSNSNSPSDKAFPALRANDREQGRDRDGNLLLQQRGSVGSDYTSSSRTSSPHRLVRALSSRFRPRSRTANSHTDAITSTTPEVVETLKYKRPKSAHSTLSLNGLANWGRGTRAVTKKPSDSEFGVRSTLSHNDATNTIPLSPNSPLLATFFHPSPKAAHLTIPDVARASSRNQSHDTLPVEGGSVSPHEASPLKLRSQSLPVDAIIRAERDLRAKAEEVDREIKERATVVTAPVTRAPTPPPKDPRRRSGTHSRSPSTPIPILFQSPLPEPPTLPSTPTTEHVPNIMAMLQMVEDRLSKLNYGAVNIAAHYNGVSPTYSWSPLGWDPNRGMAPPAESPTPIHPAFKGMMVDQSPGLERLGELGVEGHPQGMFPSTTTIAGMGWERWEVASRGRRQTIYFMQGALPPLSGPELVAKLQSAKRDLLPSNAMDEAESLRSIIGQGTSAFFDVDRPYNSQAGDLLRTLNREDLFEDFTLADSIYLLAIAPPPTGMGVRLFLLQVLLGYELYLRLKACGDSKTFSGITQLVNASLEVAVRWVDNVSSEISDGALKVYSKVHETQVAGLIAFAREMQWPYLEEVEEFANCAYERHLNGNIVDVHFLDWLYGTCLPGRWFAWKTMCAAIYASQSLRRFGTTPYFDAGLVLDHQSYWRTRTPLAQIFGGLEGVKSIAGWVGPCPPVRTFEGEYYKGWIRIKSIPAEFTQVGQAVGDEMTEDEHELVDRGLRVRKGETPRGLLNELADMTKWVLPPPLTKSSTRTKLEAVELEKLPLEEDEEGSSQQANARLVFRLDRDRRVEYSVKYCPVFVAAPPCTSGPHLAHSRELERYLRVVDVRDLKVPPSTDSRQDRTDEQVNGTESISTISNGINGTQGHTHIPLPITVPSRTPRSSVEHSHIPPPGTMLLINATGGGDAEALARAWCAEVGRHAVVSRSGSTCLTCSFNTTENMELDVLILS